ncbi:MAG: hypothetical protein ACRD4G_13775, partial [Bryobacteraceae bacterium]
MLAQLLAAQSSTARGSQVSGKPAAQAKIQSGNGDLSGNALSIGQVASRQSTKGDPVSSGPATRQTTQNDGLSSVAGASRPAAKKDALPPQTAELQSSKGADASDAVSADGKLQKGRQDDMFTGPNPKQVREQKAAPQPEIQGQPPQHSAGTSADAAGHAGKKPVAQPTALLLLPDEAIAGKPSGAPPPAAAEKPKAPQDPTLEPQENTPASKATAKHAAHERQAPSGTVLPAVTQPAPAPASVLPLPPAPQPANSGNQKAIVQPAAPGGVANLSTVPATASAVPATASAAPAAASAAPAAGPAPMPGEHLAFALSATVANGAAAPSAPQSAPQAGSQPLAISVAGTPKTADRVAAAMPVPAASVPQQA